MDSAKIGTFKQFLKQQKQKKINEANTVSVSVEWWDECVVQVLQQIESEAQGMFWDNIIKFCRNKWAILGRPLPLPDQDDNILTQHIKDLIFQFHGDSFYTDWKCDYGWDNQQVHSKGLVIEELAATILEKIREKTRPQGEPDTGEATGTLSDREKATLVPMKPCPAIDDNGTVEYEEDLPYEYESHKVKPVKGFNDYIKALNETVAMIDCDNLEDCIQHTLGILQKMVGSLDPGEIAIKAYQVASPEAKTDLVINLLKNIVYDYLSSQDSQVKIIGNGGSKDTKDNIPEDVYEQGLDALCDDIVDEILGRLAKENGGDYEAV